MFREAQLFERIAFPAAESLVNEQQQTTSNCLITVIQLVLVLVLSMSQLQRLNMVSAEYNGVLHRYWVMLAHLTLQLIRTIQDSP